VLLLKLNPCLGRCWAMWWLLAYPYHGDAAVVGVPILDSMRICALTAVNTVVAGRDHLLPRAMNPQGKDMATPLMETVS